MPTPVLLLKLRANARKIPGVPSPNRGYPPKGVRSKTKRAGIEGMGYTYWLTRERMKANNLKMIVVVVAVVVSCLKNEYC